MECLKSIDLLDFAVRLACNRCKSKTILLCACKSSLILENGGVHFPRKPNQKSFLLQIVPGSEYHYAQQHTLAEELKFKTMPE